jgi:hypothetical protein
MFYFTKKIKPFATFSNVSEPDLDPDWIQVQGKNNPQKRKKVNKFHVLKCWMFALGGLKA